ncbi:tetratricopeptide repeat protein [Flaviaesturariibacter aridisoli]|uniref:Tetratricopeptide repeat protein n=1 Tax=Flaviaesturariibacter aridisoli TaxID=2545761 RepID=A0A4R4E4L5_9BACT|nr:tetratricopeptide repeat protein [Flaviaesturariibacter aridisoli]TCZ72160.1 tetratricopeptide repeat protein [Flaviaesturariibacter aridisoli]
MKKLLLPFAFLAAALPAAACINGETREPKDGTLLFADRGGESRVPRGHDFEKIDYAATTARLEQGWRRTGDAAYRSDMGVLLILQKKYTEARDLYLDLERRKPGRYSTASNLGTVYELLGKNDSALLWIRRAVAIDPKSHRGSEWIHVNILEAKAAGNANPSTSDLLDADLGRDAKPRWTAAGRSPWTLDEAIFYQLNERMSFLAPPDPVIGRLLFELGNLRWLQHDPTSVGALYGAARRYGFTDTLLLRRAQTLSDSLVAAGKTDAALQQLVKDARPAPTVMAATKPAPSNTLYWSLAGIFVFLGAFVWLLARRRRR